ncbi:MAG TPA: nuclear transport factor 2 family protein [Pyrinomonadaceae bacterium]|jgi:ketosteroid isomerase-like protein|nr:nuclear transport factor 2 family protein [Pyrinomonadaceae bacterium]
MTLRILGCSLFSFILGIAFVVAITPAMSSGNIQDDRAADREAIRAHLDSIFQAFIKKDAAALRATHADNWLGYLEGSRTMLKSVEGYMEANQLDPKSPYGMKSYKLREFDMIFKGDAAFVCFVPEIELNTPNGPYHRVMRMCDFYTKDSGHWIQSGGVKALHAETVEDQMAAPQPLGDQMKQRLLDAREAVWRAYFVGDRVTLEKFIPEETITIEADENTWGNRQMVLDGAERFVKAGGKLLKLEFPKTEVQTYGSTAIVYSNYSYEIEIGSQHINKTGRVTEVFVLRKGEWVNPGWHMDSGK